MNETGEMALNRFRGIWRSAVFVLAAALASQTAMPASTVAAKEGVYVSSDVFFTLEQVWHAPGPDGTWLRFDLRLHNGGASPVDFNRYGVRVKDADGRAYSVRLNGVHAARVPANEERDFSYIVRLPGNIPAERLSVSVFRWGSGILARSTELGSLSVAAALAESPARRPAVRVDLRQVDSSLPGETPVRFAVGGVYPVEENGRAELLVVTEATNESARVAAIPGRLQFRLVAADGRTYPASIVSGADRPLLPGRASTVVLSAPAEGLADGDVPPILRLVSAAGSTNGAAGEAAETTIAELAPLTAAQPAKAGSTVAVTVGGGKSRVAVAIDPAKTWRTDAGLVVRASVRVRNDGNAPVAAPELSAQIQAPSLETAAEARDAVSPHADWISPGGEETYSFAAVLPDGARADDIRLVLFESGGDQQGGARIPLLAARPAAGTAANLAESAVDYRFGEPLAVVPAGASAGQTEVSLEDLKLYENGDGFPTAVATFRVANVGRSPAFVPEFGTELVDARGNAYAGVRQTVAEPRKLLAPGVAAVVTYSYTLPPGGIGETAALHVYQADSATAASAGQPAVKLTLGAFRVAFRSDAVDDKTWTVYPFAVGIDDPVAYSFVSRDVVSFGLQFDLRVAKLAPVAVDADLFRLKFDLVDGNGQLVATQTLPLSSAPSGKTKITFTNSDVSRFGSDFRVEVYAVVSTPNGEVKRRLTEIPA